MSFLKIANVDKLDKFIIRIWFENVCGSSKKKNREGGSGLRAE